MTRVLWKPIARFAGHVFVGTVMLLIFGAASVALAVFVQYLDRVAIIPRFTLNVLAVVEAVFLIADALLYLAYVVMAAWSTFKELIK